MRSMPRIESRFERCPGYSKGCAELAAKTPPPFVPSILRASTAATGRLRVCGTPVTMKPTPKNTPRGEQHPKDDAQQVPPGGSRR